ncbi:hypothetical protein [Bailinhaonella thermotolerans]|uniref:DUF2306 domain-containing protein n=1 Tax=Bailinhaonella thermotolerans TaxID=1070861 RepID=A0A3A4B7N2_9ACTN|nr:hypothetical protein [Bailinhaonella thermotolerans]RJL33504.1 hypothetical protein D5H75_12075 [Bailinhaonella thermotolerans]
MYGFLLVVHVITGFIGLLLAGPVLLVRKRRGVHTVLGRVYAGAAVLMSVSALALIGHEPRLWPLGIIAVLVLAMIGPGLALAARRPRGWFIWHLNLMASSAVAFVTAFAVQMSDLHPLAWVIPPAVGTVLITFRSLVAQGVIPRRAVRARPRSLTGSAARAGHAGR